MANLKKIMIVAGEASGDAHAAKLVRALRESAPETGFEFFGAAGPKLRDAGVEPIVRSDGFAIIGLAEIAAKLSMFLRAFRALKQSAVERKPDAVILIDFPEFNLKLARVLKRKGLLVIYYISPQLWAWRKYRVRTIRKYVDLLITILPFEENWYAQQGILNVEYVGSPLTREVHADIGKDDFCRKHGLDPTKPIVSLLPGSRHKEIIRILPVLLEAASEQSKLNENVQFVIALVHGRNPSEVKTAVETANNNAVRPPIPIIIVEDETYNALNASDAAVVTSGTATLEAGILGTPMAIVYKTSLLNYKLFEPMISVEHYGLINLIAEKRIAREFIQYDFAAKTISDEISRLLEPFGNAAMREELRTATDKLGHGGASKRAAEAILRLINQESTRKIILAPHPEVLNSPDGQS